MLMMKRLMPHCRDYLEFLHLNISGYGRLNANLNFRFTARRFTLILTSIFNYDTYNLAISNLRTIYLCYSVSHLYFK